MATEPTREERKAFVEQRHEIIQELLQERDSVATEELASRFGVSHMTIYRDLKSLEASGLLRRVHGGAIKNDGNQVEPVFASKRVENVHQKEKIARFAATRFVQYGDVVILEGGTTSVATIKHLRQKQVTVLTNGLEVINEAAPLSSELTVLCCGGILRRGSNTFVGPTSEDFFRHNRGRTFFLGASGLVFPDGITDPNPLEIQVKRAMADAAEQIVLLLDSSKMGRRSLSTTLPLERVDCVVTDEGISDAYAERLRDAGVEVFVAE